MKIDQFLKNSIIALKKSGSGSPELDAKVLLKYVLAQDETFILLNGEMPLTNFQLAKLNRLINRRKKGEPIAYLTKEKEFFGYRFFVNKNVLIPRPESERLVELALDFIKQNPENKKLKIIDIGTGSGCLVISLAKKLESLLTFDFKPLTELFASDISQKALTVAKKNAGNLEVGDKISFFHSDLFANHLLHKKYDIIIANLPYVPGQVKSKKFKVKSNESNTEIDFEPQEAIFADDNGAKIIKKFLCQAKNYLSDGGVILIELDPRNATYIQKYAQNIFLNFKIELSKDLAGLDRYLIIRER